MNLGLFKKWYCAVLIVLCSCVFAIGQNTFVDDPIAAALDSLATKKVLEHAYSKPVFPKNNKYKFAADSIPAYDDFTYESRIAKLDAASPFDLQFNEHVKGYVLLYANRKREQVSRMMAQAQFYYPMFEEVFDKYNIPLELRHLAVIESALNPTIKSRAGAMGLWQFMYPTGKMYGLNINSYVDERCDPYKSTVAAAEYLKSLYGMFKDWQMVLAAYNAGPGTINKAIRRSGGKKTYWEIRPYLPTETQGYVPAFIAANYIMNYTAEHNLYSAVPKKTFFEVDTVLVKEPMSFDLLAQALDMGSDEIKYFNPAYTKNIIPGGGYSLTLPKNKIGNFLNNEEEIYAFIRAQQDQQKMLAMNTGVTKKGKTAEEKVWHTVKKGEKLSNIARKYGVTVADIKNWNVIGKKGLYSGKKLAIYKPVPVKNEPVKNVTDTIHSKINEENNVAENKTESEKVTTASVKNGKVKYGTHVVKKGETLYSIASKYGVTVGELKEMNGLSKKSLLKGQKLKYAIKKG